MAYYTFIFFSVLLATVFAEVAKIRSCSSNDGPAQCTVSEVRINPCPANKKNICVFKRGSGGTNSSMSFDFTPNFTSSNLKTFVYWHDSLNNDVPFPDMESDDGCRYTTCPTESGKSQTLNYSLHIGSKIPRGTYDFKWKVWDRDNESRECCFLTTIQIKK